MFNTNWAEWRLKREPWRRGTYLELVEERSDYYYSPTRFYEARVRFGTPNEPGHISHTVIVGEEDCEFWPKGKVQ